MIEVKNIHKSFKNTQVLKGVDLVVEEGQTVALIGSSGSGKSTLLRCINLLETPDEGEVKIGTVYIHAKIFEGARVSINIKDRGCGIADVKKAMEPLFTTCETGERAGLGFSIMGSFMDRLRVRSKPGSGTSVTLEKIIVSKGK